MNDTTKQDLLANLAALPRMASAWAMTAVGAIAVVWFQLPADQQKTLLEHSPLPIWSYPIVLTVLCIVSRVWPQKGFTAGVQPTDSPNITGATP